MAPAASAGATVLGVGLVGTDTPATLAATGAPSYLITLIAVVLLAMGLLLVAWSAKHPRR